MVATTALGLLWPAWKSWNAAEVARPLPARLKRTGTAH